MAEDITYVYHSLNLPMEKLREYNVEKYHFLSGILDILVFYSQTKGKFDLTLDGIYKHFQNHNLNIENEREKFNAAIAQLKGSEMIAFTKEGIVGITDKGLDAYDKQIFHSIAASLYSADRANHLADRSNHLAKVAITAASLLSVISITCTIISICCNS